VQHRIANVKYNNDVKALQQQKHVQIEK